MLRINFIWIHSCKNTTLGYLKFPLHLFDVWVYFLKPKKHFTTCLIETKVFVYNIYISLLVFIKKLYFENSHYLTVSGKLTIKKFVYIRGGYEFWLYPDLIVFVFFSNPDPVSLEDVDPDRIWFCWLHSKYILVIFKLKRVYFTESYCCVFSLHRNWICVYWFLFLIYWFLLLINHVFTCLFSNSLLIFVKIFVNYKLHTPGSGLDLMDVKI